jgi:hypothetical protein
MELELLKAVLAAGDNHGSAFKDLIRDLEADNLETVTDEQVRAWLARKGGGNDELGNDAAD